MLGRVRREIGLRVAGVRFAPATIALVEQDNPVRSRIKKAPHPRRAAGAWAAVNHDGVVGVLWYDRREASDNLAYHARFAASWDGGRPCRTHRSWR